MFFLLFYPLFTEAVDRFVILMEESVPKRYSVAALSFPSSGMGVTPPTLSSTISLSDGRERESFDSVQPCGWVSSFWTARILGGMLPALRLSHLPLYGVRAGFPACFWARICFFFLQGSADPPRGFPDGLSYQDEDWGGVLLVVGHWCLGKEFAWIKTLLFVGCSPGSWRGIPKRDESISQVMSRGGRSRDSSALQMMECGGLFLDRFGLLLFERGSRIEG